MKDSEPHLRLVVDNSGAVRELKEAAEPIALLVKHFSGPDEALIPIKAGELRRLLAAIEMLDMKG